VINLQSTNLTLHVTIFYNECFFRARRDEKRPPPRRDDYRHSSPARENRFSSRDKVDRRGKEESRPSTRYESKGESVVWLLYILLSIVKKYDEDPKQ